MVYLHVIVVAFVVLIFAMPILFPDAKVKLHNRGDK